MYSDAAQWSEIRRLILEQGTPITVLHGPVAWTQ
jgi:hypothetical protein